MHIQEVPDILGHKFIIFFFFAGTEKTDGTPVLFYQLTHSQENILDLQWLDSNEMNPDELEALARNMVAHLRHLLDQRDTHLEVLFHFAFGCISYIRYCAQQQDVFLQTIAELVQEKEGCPISAVNSPQTGSYPGHGLQQQQQQVETQQHLVVELAGSKAKIRRLRQEL